MKDERTKIVLTFLVLFSINYQVMAQSLKAANNRETATLGNGCFWCTEAIFVELKGVISVTPGYSGGKTTNHEYRQVCTGTTGHAECIQIIFDPSILSYQDLLEVFFMTHDPTTLNRQGADVGTQYRSIVFYHDEKQKTEAMTMIARLNSRTLWPKPIVTQVTHFEKFYPAEDYHRNYYENNPNQGYCKVVITPKIEKFRKMFVEKIGNP